MTPLTDKTQTGRTGRRKKGSAMVEFAIVASVLLLLMGGAGDFARVFFNAITVANASSTGAFWGTYNNVRAAQTASQETAAEDDARNVGAGVSATSTMYCECTNGNSTNCLNPNCSSANGPMRVYAKTIVEQTVDTYMTWPGGPDGVVVNRETHYRVQ